MMTDSSIAMIIGVLLLSLGLFSKNINFKKMQNKASRNVKYLYILAGLLLVFIGIFQQF
ncbi:hypothetical protein FD46_GL001018 [Liquorilactobacillus oeni DSM 19972]|uniref:Uncharacterized protein n=2 Tax=Liquorilactobacillus oeni TaxID=303241 RepID=A0A0R1MKI6_9LACO|nr:hypothetical protein FD46_GL001018 [Liquorilactobacillus oeni DSM 19972]